jgi:hypothetical protein
MAENQHSTDTVLSSLIDETELFHTTSREAYATIPVNGHQETWALKSEGFQILLAHHYYQQTRTMPNDTSLKKFIRTLVLLRYFAILNPYLLLIPEVVLQEEKGSCGTTARYAVRATH